MKVTLKTPYGKLKLNLTPPQVASLIQQAVGYTMEPYLVEAFLVEASGCDEPDSDNSNDAPVADVEPAPVEEKSEDKPAPVGEVSKARNSRVANMFGDKSKWAIPMQETEPTKENDDRAPLEPTYTGFIYARCEQCGAEKGYCAKVPVNSHRCDCGHTTGLRDLRPAFVECECGRKFKYRTNIRDKQFAINCLNCGTPVDLELNKSWTAYATMR